MMVRTIRSLSLVLLLIAPIWVPSDLAASEDDDIQASTTEAAGDATNDEEAELNPEQRFQSLQKDFAKRLSELSREIGSARSIDERAKVIEKRRELESDMAEQVKKLMAEADDKEFSAKALAWMAMNFMGDPAQRAIEQLVEHHSDSPVMASIASRVARMQPSAKTEELLRTIVKNAPDVEAKGQATYALASYLSNLRRYVELDDLTKQRLARVLGQETADYLAKRTPEEIDKESTELFEECLDNYGDVRIGRQKLGEIAENKLFVLKHLQIGKVAPDIEGKDLDGVEFKLSDYRGNVVVLDFWGDW